MNNKNTKCLFGWCCVARKVSHHQIRFCIVVRWYLYIIGYLDWCNEWWIVYVGTKLFNQFYISDASAHICTKPIQILVVFFFVRLEPITTRWMWIKKMLRNSREFRHFVKMCVRVSIRKKNMKGSWLHRKRLNCSRTVNAVRLFDTQNSLKFWNRALYRQCNAFDHGANSKRIQFISVDMDIDLMEIKQCTPQQQQQQQYCTNTFQTKTSFFARHEIHDIVPLKLAHAFSTLTIFRMRTITDQWTLCVCVSGCVKS